MGDSLVRLLLDQLADKMDGPRLRGVDGRLASDREVAQLVAAHRPSIVPPHTCPADRHCLACWMTPPAAADREEPT